MSRLSFRPRPLDIHKKLPIVKSVKEFEDDETPTSTRNSQIMRLAAEADTEVLVQLGVRYIGSTFFCSINSFVVLVLYHVAAIQSIVYKL